MKHHRWVGMTIIELLTTIAIIGLLTILALPPLRGLQGRQDMYVTQRNIQSALYRMQQLALAPQTKSSETYDIIGYGLLFHPRERGEQLGIADCILQTYPERDFLALIKFVRLRDAQGTIKPLLNAGEPGNCTIDWHASTTDFYVLPRGVVMAPGVSQPPFSQSQWLLVTPLVASGSSFGQLQSYLPTQQFIDPLDSPSARLMIKHTSIRVGPAPLCLEVTFSRQSNSIESSSRKSTQC